MNKRSAMVPPPFQAGYVVDDMNAALKYWTEVVGAGPFFVYPAREWEELYYKGEPIHLDTMMAIGQWGDTQIEFIQQVNDSPSPYKAFVEKGLRGMHHYGSMVDDLDDAVRRLAAVGKERVYWGVAKGGVKFAYFVDDEHPGSMIELLEHGPLIDGLMQMVRDAARDWDGADPIRTLG